MNKTDKIIFYSFLYIPAIVLFGYLLWTINFGETVYEAIARADLNEAVTGRVDSLYREPQNHNIKVALLTNGRKFSINAMWENLIEKGDSLSKKKGATILEIHRDSGKRFTLDYRDTYLQNK